jgi:HEAT repeat protein
MKKLAKLAASKDIDDVINVAAACSCGRDEEPYNILVDLTSHKDQAVRLAAISGLGDCRYSIESQITRLMWISEQANGNTEITGAVSRSVAKLKAARK